MRIFNLASKAAVILAYRPLALAVDAIMIPGGYTSLGYNEGPFELSGGLARRSNSGAPQFRSPLSGSFGGAAWQPLTWVRGMLN